MAKYKEVGTLLRHIAAKINKHFVSYMQLIHPKCLKVNRISFLAADNSWNCREHGDNTNSNRFNLFALGAATFAGSYGKFVLYSVLL